MGSSLSSTSTSSSRPLSSYRHSYRRAQTKEPNVAVNLDEQDIFDQVHGFGDDCRGKRNEIVKIRIMARRMYSGARRNNFTWLLMGGDFYTTIEYSEAGIEVNYYQRNEHTLENVYRGITGDDQVIFYYDQFKTHLTFGEILQKLNDLKDEYNAESYSDTARNNEDFAKRFGKILDSSFYIPNLLNWNFFS